MNPFDLEDGDFLFGSGDNRFDSDGHMMHHIGGNMAIDMNTGNLHIVHGWDNDENDG